MCNADDFHMNRVVAHGMHTHSAQWVPTISFLFIVVRYLYSQDIVQCAIYALCRRTSIFFFSLQFHKFRKPKSTQADVHIWNTQQYTLHMVINMRCMRVRLSTHLLSFCRLSQGANESISSFYSFRNRFRFVISLLVILLFEKKKKWRRRRWWRRRKQSTWRKNENPSNWKQTTEKYIACLNNHTNIQCEPIEIIHTTRTR